VRNNDFIFLVGLTDITNFASSVPAKAKRT
jgi:hypothetical protein